MTAADLSVFTAYLVVLLVLGAVWSRRQREPGEFFLAGRGMSWLPVGLSIMATAFSAMNYMAFAGEVATEGLYVALSVPVFVIVAWPVLALIMPFFHDMRLTSAYEYLERRFDRRVRRLASGVFILWRVAWMAVALYVPSVVLSKLTGLPLWLLVALAGLVATTYTLVGGMRAVMWTDVLQVAVLVGGLFVAVGLAAAHQEGGLAGLVRQAVADGLTKPFVPFDPRVLSLDPRIRITVWSALIGTFVAFLTRYGADQVVMQRYFSARSLKHARLGFHLNYAVAVIALILLALFGFAIHAHAVAAGIAGTKGSLPAPYFIAFVAALPSGVTGLIAAGLLAATMSSVDSGVNACAAAIACDFRGADAPEPSLGRERLVTLALGVVCTLLACQVGRLGSLFVVANKIINGLGSPLLALFVLAMFSRRATAAGVLWGGLAGLVASILVSLFVAPLALHYYAVANLLVTLAAAWLGSLATAPPTAAQLAWTWMARRQAQTVRK